MKHEIYDARRFTLGSGRYSVVSSHRRILLFLGNETEIRIRRIQVDWFGMLEQYSANTKGYGRDCGCISVEV